MRKNKGYQKDIHKVSWRTKKQSNSYASGENKSLEQCLKEIDEDFDRRLTYSHCFSCGILDHFVLDACVSCPLTRCLVGLILTCQFVDAPTKNVFSSVNVTVMD